MVAVAPLFAGPDESDHAVRAAAVVRGQLVGAAPQGAKNYVSVRVRVPEAYANADFFSCFVYHPDLTPKCGTAFEGTQRRLPAITDEHRSLPAYYAVVGWPTLLQPSGTGAYAVRALSALLCAALLASAFASALELVPGSLAVLGVFVAVTPEVLFLGGLISSSAIEIAAAVCAWASLFAIARAAEPPSRRLIARASIALAVLVLTRGLSWLFALIALLVVGALADSTRLRELGRRRDVHIGAAAVGASFVGAAAWLSFLQIRYPLSRHGTGLVGAVVHTGADLQQSVGVFNWHAVGILRYNPLALPWPVYVIWGAVTVTLLAVALYGARRRERAVLGGLLVIGFVLPITATVWNIPPIGLAWQGRYGLPLITGLPILAGGLIRTRLGDRNGRSPFVSRLPAVAISLLVLAQVVAFTATVRRFAVGSKGSTNPLQFLFHPVWSPPHGRAVLFLALFALSLVALAVVTSRAATTRTAHEDVSL